MTAMDNASVTLLIISVAAAALSASLQRDSHVDDGNGLITQKMHFLVLHYNVVASRVACCHPDHITRPRLAPAPPPPPAPAPKQRKQPVADSATTAGQQPNARSTVEWGCIDMSWDFGTL